MTLEFILKCAVSSMIKGHHTPHCYSAWVQNQGYINKGDDPATRADYLRQLEHTAHSEVDNLQWSHAYAIGQGYDDPKRGVVFANWNHFPCGLDDILERAGYAVEWSDEWTTCSSCNKAIRTSPDSYSWSIAASDSEDGNIYCLECIDPAEHLESLEDNPRKANVVHSINPADHGYVRATPDDYENGFHPGQTDDPKAIYAHLTARGLSHILFNLDDKGQFDIRFSVWHKSVEADEDDD